MRRFLRVFRDHTVEDAQEERNDAVVFLRNIGLHSGFCPIHTCAEAGVSQEMDQHRELHLVDVPVIEKRDDVA